MRVPDGVTMTMERHYNGSYFFAEKYGPKRYARSDGSVGEFGYTHGGLWNFQGILNKLIELLGAPRSVLDVGCGCGGFPATLRDNYIEALGLEFSQWAIDNAVMGSRPLIKKWDVADVPWPVNQQYDWVTCFPRDTYILTYQGWRDISFIKEGDIVMSHIGWTKVTKTFLRVYQGDMVEIKPRYAPPIMATPEHRFLTVKRRTTYSTGKFFAKPVREEWVEAQELRPRDYLLFNIPLEVLDVKELDLLSEIGRGDADRFLLYRDVLDLRKQGKTLNDIRDELGVPRKTAHQWIRGDKFPHNVILEYGDSYLKMPNSHKITRLVSVDDAFMELMGLYIGDGSTNRGNVFFTYGEGDKAIERTVELADRVFGLNATVEKSTYALNVVLSSKIVAMLFKALFNRKHAHEKRMPQWFIYLPQNKQEALLRGLVLSDGSKGNYGGRIRTAIVTTSKVLAMQVWLILLRGGILASFHRRRPGKPRFEAKHDAYHIIYNRPAQFRAGFIRNGKAYLPVYRVRRVPYDGLVYNLETEHNSYVTHSGCAHNCIDLMEHLFADKVDSVVAETKRRARRWIVAKICTAQLPHEVWSARRGTYEEVLAQAKAEGYEWLIVSGHVTSMPPQFWRNKFEDKEWRLRDDLAERFKKELKLPEDWRTTIFAERVNWFEMEFGRR